MPQVIPWVAAKVGTLFIAAGASSGAAMVAANVAGYAAGFLLKYAVPALAVNAISRAIAKKPSLPSLRAQGVEVNVRDPAAPRQIIYGQRRVSGVLYPVGTSGTNNEYLHLLLLVAGHECEELGDVTFNDEVVPLDGSGNATGRYAGFVRIKKHLGAYNQTVDTDLQTDLTAGYWSNNHRLQGIAYLYIRLKVSADLFPGGIPELYCLVKGRKVYDSRDGTHDAADASTWDWTANAALCLNDWVRGVPYRNGAGTIVRNHGVGALDAEIDYTDTAAAANICDEDVVLDDASTEDRYTCNGVMLTSVRAGDGIELLKSAMAGDCVYVGGKWTILAGAYRTPTLAAFDEGDLRAPLTGVRLKPSTGELFNRGRGLYVSADNNWQPTDLPQVTNSTYLTQDGGDELPADMEFPFTTSSPTGQRLLKIAIERSRQGIAFVAKCKLSAWQVRTGDVILWTDAEIGWSSKAFEVLGVALAVESDANGHPYLGCDLTLKETASAVWDWANGEETVVDPAPNTSLRSPFDVEPPTSLAVSSTYEQQDDGTIIPMLEVSWTAPADANVTTRGNIRLEYKLNADSDWLPMDLIRGDITVAFLLAVVVGESYDVRIRSENDLGQPSSWVTDTATTADGKTTGPAAPSSLVYTAGDDADFNRPGVWSFFVSGPLLFYSFRVNWTAPADNDVAYYEWKTTATNSSGAAALDSGIVPIAEAVVSTGLTYVGYFFVRAVNTSGVAGSWGGGGTDVSSPSLWGHPAGTMSQQDYDDVDVTGGTAVGLTNVENTGIKTGAGSSTKKVLCRQPINAAITLTGGAPTESYDLSLTNYGFSTAPDAGWFQADDTASIEVRYDWDDSSSSVAKLRIRTLDGTNLGTAMHITGELVEYD